MDHQPVTKKDIVDMKVAFAREVKDRIEVLRQERERDLNTLRDERAKDMENISNMLKPTMDMAETYRAATIMGKWLMAIAIFISIFLGIILSIKALK